MPTLFPRRPVRRLTLTIAATVAILGCDREPLGIDPDFAKSGPTPLTAAPSSLWLRVGPPTFTATVTARVQYVGIIASKSSDESCATVAPASLPATKPAGSPLYVATFTITPVGAGTCTVTLTDKKGTQVTVQVRVRAQRLVFATTRDGNGNLEIYDMLPDGTDPVRLTNNAARDDVPSVARDGSKIVFTSDRDGNNEIYVMNPDGSNPTRLTTNAASDVNPGFSPDGARIVFQTDRDGNFDIYTMAVDGTDLRRLTDNATIDRYPAWSPDGTKIAFTSRPAAAGADHLSVMGADGSGVTALTSGSGFADGDGAWSPDGTRIVFTSSRPGFPISEIYVMNADGSDITRLTSDTDLELNPVFSLDGSRIAFASTRDHPEDNTTNAFEIYTMDASNGGNVTRLTTNALIDWSPAF
jgi:Tol biopolymer transport system component